jgi:ubiquinone/menaquinone biosynthesis C-methylase UbiE
MSAASDARFWDRTSTKYARSAISDQAGYVRSLERTRALLSPDDRVLELGCGTGSTALLLASGVKSYLATDFSTGMIAIAEEKHAAAPVPGLAFRTASAEALEPEAAQFNAILCFNYLHLVRNLPGTLQRIYALLSDDGLFVSKTPCVGDMNPLIRLALLVMRLVRMAPFAGVFTAPELGRAISDAGFKILCTEIHASKGNDNRSYVVARKA